MPPVLRRLAAPLLLVLPVALSAGACSFPDLPALTDAGAQGPDADLRRPQPLTVAVTGDGTVTSDPAGIECDPTCQASFDPLAPVTLEARAAATSVFLGWSGDCAGTGPCRLTMDAAKRVSARFAPHGSPLWVEQIGFAGDDAIEDVAVDAEGNVVVAGTVDDGNGADLFVAKYAAGDGRELWTRRFATDVGETIGGLATDASGNAYVAIRVQGGAVSYDGRPVTGDIFGNVVVLRLSARTGTVDWAKQWGGSSVDYPTAIAVSGTDLFVVGYSSSNPSMFDARSFAGQTGNGFLVRASTESGTAAALAPVTGSAELFDIAVNGTHVAVSGRANGAAALAPCTMTPSGAGNDAIVLDVIGATLACTWSSTLGDMAAGNDAFMTTVAPMPDGGWVTAGTFEGSFPGTGSAYLTSRGAFDVILQRYDRDGQRRWAFQYGGTGDESAGAVATLPSGNVVLSGSFDGAVTLGSFTVNGAANVFVTRLSADAVPVHEWAVSLGGADADSAQNLVVSADGTVHVAARFSGMTTVGGRTFAAQAADAWIASLLR